MLTAICHQAGLQHTTVPICVEEYTSGIGDIEAAFPNQLSHNTITTELRQTSAQPITVNLTVPDIL